MGGSRTPVIGRLMFISLSLSLRLEYLISSEGGTAYHSDCSGLPMNERFNLRRVYLDPLALDAIERPALTKTFLQTETGKTFQNRMRVFEQVELVSKR